MGPYKITDVSPGTVALDGDDIQKTVSIDRVTLLPTMSTVLDAMGSANSGNEGGQ